MNELRRKWSRMKLLWRLNIERGEMIRALEKKAKIEQAMSIPEDEWTEGEWSCMKLLWPPNIEGKREISYDEGGWRIWPRQGPTTLIKRCVNKLLMIMKMKILLWAEFCLCYMNIEHTCAQGCLCIRLNEKVMLLLHVRLSNHGLLSSNWSWWYSNHATLLHWTRYHLFLSELGNFRREQSLF